MVRGRPKASCVLLDDKIPILVHSDGELGQRRTSKSKRCVRLDEIVAIQNGRRTDVFSRTKDGDLSAVFHHHKSQNSGFRGRDERWERSMTRACCVEEPGYWLNWSYKYFLFH